MRSWQDFDLINLVVLPLFLFSGTFFPITAYPEPLQILVRLTPLWQGTDMIRALTTGYVDLSILWHVLYLGVMGAVGLAVVGRRLDRLLLK
jgi:lipooligosaccharide transport system permease protein